MTHDRDALLSGIEELLRDFGRLFLADVAGVVETERKVNLSRRPIKRSVTLNEINRRAKLNQANQSGFANGLELQDRLPSNVEEWQNVQMFYWPFSGEPVLNSAGQPCVVESGWTGNHHFEFSGTNASRAVETIGRANDWAFGHWGQLSGLLFPGRSTIAPSYLWPDVVLRVAELANIKTLRKPEWFVNVGQGRWSVEVWKRRDEFTLGTPNYSEADIERIGDEPEEYYTIRDSILRDSETVLNWLNRRFSVSQPKLVPVQVNTVAERQPEASTKWNVSQQQAVQLASDWLNIPSKHGGPIRDQPRALRWLIDNGPSTHADWGIGAEMDWSDDVRDAARKLANRINQRARNCKQNWEILPENNKLVTIEMVVPKTSRKRP